MFSVTQLTSGLRVIGRMVSPVLCRYSVRLTWNPSPTTTGTVIFSPAAITRLYCFPYDEPRPGFIALPVMLTELPAASVIGTVPAMVLLSGFNVTQSEVGSVSTEVR